MFIMEGSYTYPEQRERLLPKRESFLKEKTFCGRGSFDSGENGKKKVVVQTWCVWATDVLFYLTWLRNGKAWAPTNVHARDPLLLSVPRCGVGLFLVATQTRKGKLHHDHDVDTVLQDIVVLSCRQTT